MHEGLKKIPMISISTLEDPCLSELQLEEILNGIFHIGHDTPVEDQGKEEGVISVLPLNPDSS